MRINDDDADESVVIDMVVCVYVGTCHIKAWRLYSGSQITAITLSTS